MNTHPFDELSAYVDGALSPEDATEIAVHLAECAHCREVVGDLLAVRDVIQSVPAPSPHPAILPRTLARLERRRWRAAVLRRRWIAVFSAAAAIAILLQLPLFPSPGTDRRSGAAYFRQHAELTLTHPMVDVTLASYLSSPLPYSPIDEPAGAR